MCRGRLKTKGYSLPGPRPQDSVCPLNWSRDQMGGLPTQACVDPVITFEANFQWWTSFWNLSGSEVHFSNGHQVPHSLGIPPPCYSVFINNKTPTLTICCSMGLCGGRNSHHTMLPSTFCIDGNDGSNHSQGDVLWQVILSMDFTSFLSLQI